MTMIKPIEGLFYTLFGNVAHIGHDSHLQFISSRIPEAFYNRQMIDIGCGDGTNTHKISQIFHAKTVVGYDVVPGLIKRAQKNGVEAYIKDIEVEDCFGEFGVLWGVLHHFAFPQVILKKLKESFNYLFIREKTSSVIFEFGKPFFKEDVLKLCQTTLGEISSVEYQRKGENVIFIFWERPVNNG